ncbi:hypothetical protein I2F27_11495 [Acinetobacter sp. B5B]|uniref:hypothetical protein n=1 Tax=Acinetobacter baretiae TaxID=2605383 RepID=UPI0018C325FB|nr:hypothetical protein [Acinetobacter baretiae]MBF7683942.1 hypothetical protein [Acinetobacter baretiae]
MRNFDNVDRIDLTLDRLSVEKAFNRYKLQVKHERCVWAMMFLGSVLSMIALIVLMWIQGGNHGC